MSIQTLLLNRGCRMRERNFLWLRALASVVGVWTLASGSIDRAPILSENGAPSAGHGLHARMIPIYGPDGLLIRGPQNEMVSGNWSGYLVAGGIFTAAEGTWTVPAVSFVGYSGSPNVQESSSWVGIGGVGYDETLIQLGTSQHVSADGAVAYYPWYELLPAYETPLPFPVNPGDVITASVECLTNCKSNAQQTWRLKMKNSSQNWDWTDTFAYSSSLLTAEWILEAETACVDGNCQISPLPNYGSAGFSNLTLNGNNPNLSVSNGVILQDQYGGNSSPCPATGGDRFLVDFGVSCASNSVQFASSGTKLVGSGGIGASAQGYSVGLSADGNTVVIGAPNDDSEGTPDHRVVKGAAWVFARTGGVWSQQGPKLVGTGRQGSADQGWSVALSADGSTAIVGGPADDLAKGAAWVFTRSGATWSQQGPKLVGTGTVGRFASQGRSVALSANGNTAIVGGPDDNSGMGAAWIFTRQGNVWTQQGPKLVGVPAASRSGVLQGTSVGLSADGNVAILGGPSDNSGLGAAWIFTRSSGEWRQSAKLVGSGYFGIIPLQGSSVALSADGNTAIVGGPSDDFASGSLWIFARSGGDWLQQGPKLIGAGATAKSGAVYQATSVSLSSTGDIAVVGGPYDVTQARLSGMGAAWVFARQSNVWTQQGWKLLGINPSGFPAIGSSVAISANGNTLAVGGPDDDSRTGAVWIFDRPVASK
jgi:hypothetical protein